MKKKQKRCISCKKHLTGRIDKKYCDDYCRSAFNNKKYIIERALIRRVNYLLLKNRRILEALLAGSNSSISIMRNALASKGFQFGFCTHTWYTADGIKYFCCYDHAYSEPQNEQLMITRLHTKTTAAFIPYNESLQE